MTDVLTDLHIWFPDVPGNYFNMIAALCALCQIGTSFAFLTAAFIFPITIPVRRAVAEDLVVRTQVAVIVFIINILMFPEEPFFRHRPLVGEQWLYAVIQQELCNRWCFISGIHDHGLYVFIPDLVI